MSGIRRNLDGPYARGVVNPYTVHVHPYPTRYHGPVYTRPEFGLPYIRSPHAVFKPNDFNDFYEKDVSGLGSMGGGFGGSSIGNGTIGGNTLGLGATGTPIYYLASKTNTKVSTLQTGINKVLNANQYGSIPVTGKMDAMTCAGLAIAETNFKDELSAAVSSEIIVEAMTTCLAAMKTPAVKSQVQANTKVIIASRKPVAAELEQTTASPSITVSTPSLPSASTSFIPSTSEQDAITEPSPQQAIPTSSGAKTNEISFPDMNISAQPSVKAFTKNNNALIIGGIALAGAFLFWKMRSK